MILPAEKHELAVSGRSRSRDLVRFLSFPAALVLAAGLSVSLVQAVNLRAALLSLWEIFRIVHYVPRELAGSMIGFLDSHSPILVDLFLLYSFVGLAAFSWGFAAGLDSDKLNKTRLDREVVRSQVSKLALRNRGSECIPPMEAFERVGRVSVKHLIMVMLVALFLYVFVWASLSLMLVLVTLGLAAAGWLLDFDLGQRWLLFAYLALSPSASTLFLLWGYGVYPRRSSGAI